MQKSAPFIVRFVSDISSEERETEKERERQLNMFEKGWLDAAM